jgi:hypothetical protein
MTQHGHLYPQRRQRGLVLLAISLKTLQSALDVHVSACSQINLRSRCVVELVLVLLAQVRALLFVVGAHRNSPLLRWPLSSEVAARVGFEGCASLLLGHSARRELCTLRTTHQWLVRRHPPRCSLCVWRTFVFQLGVDSFHDSREADISCELTLRPDMEGLVGPPGLLSALAADRVSLGHGEQSAARHDFAAAGRSRNELAEVKSLRAPPSITPFFTSTLPPVMFRQFSLQRCRQYLFRLTTPNAFNYRRLRTRKARENEVKSNYFIQNRPMNM